MRSIVNRERSDWVTFDESHPLPVSASSMPLRLKAILTNERKLLADSQEVKPEFSEQTIYNEFEDILQTVDAKSVSRWCCWVILTVKHNHSPAPGADARPVFVHGAARYTGGRETLLLNP